MRLLITEYVTSTYEPSTQYISLLPEAYGMIKSLVKVFSRIDDVDTIITISKYLHKMFDNVKIDAVIIDKNYFKILEDVKDYVDYVIAIAPPYELITLSEIFKEKLLAPSFDLIRRLSNKYESILLLNNCNIKIPQTIFVCRSSDDLEIRELEFPVVVKPSMSAGAECVYIVRDRDNVVKYVKKVIECDPRGCAVVQKYIEGFHGSISMVIHNNILYLYTLNLQLISLADNRIIYHGNIVPLRNSKYVKLAKNSVVDKLLSCVDGLKGYLGLDVVWNEENMYVVEINPRFTTAGIAIAELYPDLGKTIIGYDQNIKNCYLGDIVENYAYAFKCLKYDATCLKLNFASLDFYINRLQIGYVDSFEKILKILLECDKKIVEKLIYDLTIFNKI